MKYSTSHLYSHWTDLIIILALGEKIIFSVSCERTYKRRVISIGLYCFKSNVKFEATITNAIQRNYMIHKLVFQERMLKTSSSLRINDKSSIALSFLIFHIIEILISLPMLHRVWNFQKLYFCYRISLIRIYSTFMTPTKGVDVLNTYRQTNV